MNRLRVSLCATPLRKGADDFVLVVVGWQRNLSTVLLVAAAHVPLKRRTHSNHQVLA